MLTEGVYPVPSGKIAAVVTHLEMLAPPASAPASFPNGTRMNRVDRPNVDWYRDLFTRVGALDWLWFSRLRMDDATLGAILGDPLVEIFALEKADRAEGLLELDFRDGATCELAFLGLTPTLQGAGVGRALMSAAIDRAFARPITKFHIHTCTFDSPVALPFYIRSGFMPVRREIEIVDDPRLTGTIPEGAAAHIPVIR